MGNVLNLINGGYDDEDNVVNFNERQQQQHHMSSSSSSSFGHNSNGQLDSMVESVKVVLPQVPISVIRKDLCVTSNVEETITRLVDGTIQYTPETPETNKSSSSQANSAKVSNFNTSSLPTNISNSDSLPTLSTAAKSFGNSANERHKSFEERKRQLIESARLRYMIKHNMLTSAN